MTDWDDAIVMVEDKKPDYVIPALLLLVAIGTALRFYNLAGFSLWLDEAFTLKFSMASYGRIWVNVIEGEFNPPLFYWLEHAMIWMFGQSEYVLRALPALFGALSVPVFYLVGKEFRDEYTGLIMAAICTFSPFLIWYSQEARTYSLLLLLVAGATYYYFKSFRTGSILDWSLFALFGAVAFWSHFYALVIIVSMFIFAGVWYVIDRNLKPVLISFGIWVLASLPLFTMLFPLLVKRTAAPPTYGYQGVTLLYEIFKNFSGFADLMVPVFMFLFVLGIIVTAHERGWKQFFILWIFVVTFLFSLMAGAIIPMLPKYLIFMTIFFFLGIAASYEYIVAWLPKGKDPVYAVLWMSVFFAMMCIPFATVYYPGGLKDDWRGVATYLENQTEPYDIVVPVPGYVQLPLDYYYSAEEDGTIEEPIDPGAMITSFEFIREHRSFIDGTIRTPTVYYVVTGDISAADPSGETLAWLNHNATLLKEFNLGINIMKGV